MFYWLLASELRTHLGALDKHQTKVYSILMQASNKACKNIQKLLLFGVWTAYTYYTAGDYRLRGAKIAKLTCYQAKNIILQIIYILQIFIICFIHYILYIINLIKIGVAFMCNEHFQLSIFLKLVLLLLSFFWLIMWNCCLFNVLFVC